MRLILGVLAENFKMDLLTTVYLPKSVAMFGLKKFRSNRWRKLPAKSIGQQALLPAWPFHIRSFQEHF